MNKISDWIKEAWSKINRFMREVQTEMKKVSWPPRKEIIGSTVVVIISVIIISFFLGLVDVFLQKGLGYIIK